MHALNENFKPNFTQNSYVENATLIPLIVCNITANVSGDTQMTNIKSVYMSNSYACIFNKQYALIGFLRMAGFSSRDDTDLV